MERDDLAWAAGFFDAEGSISHHLPRGRAVRRPTLDVSQGGGASPPAALLQFREILGGGRIFGPYRGYLHYWRSHDGGVISSSVMLLWPWLSAEKREQIRATLASVPALWSSEALAAIWDAHVQAHPHPDEERAWAAGFFDGDGSVGAYVQRTTASKYLVLSASISQASLAGVPTSLSRFHAVVGVGAVRGPYGPTGWSRLPQYRWQVKGRAVEQVVDRLLPLMRSDKKARAERAVATAARSFAQRATSRAVRGWNSVP